MRYQQRDEAQRQDFQQTLSQFEEHQMVWVSVVSTKTSFVFTVVVHVINACMVSSLDNGFLRASA